MPWGTDCGADLDEVFKLASGPHVRGPYTRQVTVMKPDNGCAEQDCGAVGRLIEDATLKRPQSGRSRRRTLKRLRRRRELKEVALRRAKDLKEVALRSVVLCGCLEQ